ncbi:MULTISPECIES: helix-turn-helix domain-containing protein [Arthrobacter]|uniref:Helix-turn-helix domain-containing protein n=1 Tax=Arthrobacter nanjingensis TaxID=1387716 RepID=A0ABU9KPT7_9MICC
MAKKIAWEVRAEAYHRLLAGESVLGVSEVLGVSRTALSKWAMLAGMERVTGPVGGVVVAPEPVPPRQARVRRYARLGLEERAYIQACLDLAEPFSVRRIARNLGVAASTISREIREGVRWFV